MSKATNNLLAELNKRIKEKEELLKSKTEQYSEMLSNLQKIEELNKTTEAKTKELDEKLTAILEKEKELFKKEFVIQTEDGVVEVVGKDDVDIVSEISDVKSESDVKK